MVWTLSLVALSCGGPAADNPANEASGTLTYATPTDEIHAFDLAAHTDSLVLAVGTEPDRMPSGQIVYVDPGLVGSQDQLTVASANGATHSALVAPGATVASFNPVSSPDGKYIAMTYFPRGFSHGFALNDGSVFVDPSGKVALNVPGVFDPAWVSDGRVVFAGTVDVPSGTSNADPTETPVAAGLFVSSADGKTVEPIAGNLLSPQHPAVSPDGKSIAFVQLDDVWIIGMDGTGLKQVTTGDNRVPPDILTGRSSHRLPELRVLRRGQTLQRDRGGRVAARCSDEARRDSRELHRRRQPYRYLLWGAHHRRAAHGLAVATFRSVNLSTRCSALFAPGTDGRALQVGKVTPSAWRRLESRARA
jgi:hypothetical protein